MTLLQLDDDILAIIMSFTRPVDASGFARTCHAGYQLAMPRFLSEVELSLDGALMRLRSLRKKRDDDDTQGRDRSTTSLADGTLAQDSGHVETTPDCAMARFCRLILADIPGRAPHVRILTIYGTHVRPDDSDTDSGFHTCVHLLCEVLRHTVLITDVTLIDTNYFLEGYKTLTIAIAQLPNVQSFTTRRTSISVIPWQQIAFQPRKLVIDVAFERYHIGGFVESEMKAFDQMLALPNFWGHIEYLEVDHCNNLLETAAAKNAMPLSSIRTLKIGGISRGTLANAARLLPDVRTLKITLQSPGKYSTVNQLASWSRLDTVTMRSISFGSDVPAALGSDVRCLRLGTDIGSSTFRMTSTLPLLERTSPVVLAIRTNLPLCDAGSVSEFQKCVKAAPELRFIEIEFVARPHSYEQWSQFIEITQTSSLKQSRLLGLLLCRATIGARSISRDECPMIAKGLAAQILTLQYIGFQSLEKDLEWPFPSEVIHNWSIWYRVKRKEDGGEPIIEQLLPDRAYWIHRELLATSRC
ncbi:hypothetical protein WOLCODRAFT_141258 [Wolfiporia cocos MD-104 SS10]|uniref:F-box domain-containing protein n=1 Tax=Wolfiporia cocos (strain MD-104) TaxID=742152 RepID=A0A2H3JB51_WOLCO|nr:hypothetical protein WOLCODRAFT_141258 [Wolfiporia cocos MD-104 SS10]